MRINAEAVCRGLYIKHLGRELKVEQLYKMDVDEGDLFSVVFAARSAPPLANSSASSIASQPQLQPHSLYPLTSFSVDRGLNNAFIPASSLSFPCRTSSSSSASSSSSGNFFNILPPFLLDNHPHVIKLENPSPSQSSTLDSVKLTSGLGNNKLSVKTEYLGSVPSKRTGLAAPTSKQQSSKRRKEQQKRIVCVPATGSSSTNSTEFLPSDMWSWRKYGQKPIKGSPYPRSYYRCSSSKGCPARKQVERSRNDSAKLIMTYMSEHNHAWPTHRNALAGSIRHPEALPSPISPQQAESSPPLPSHTHDDDDNDNDNDDDDDDVDVDADDVQYHHHDYDHDQDHDHDHGHHHVDDHPIDMELQMLKYATEHFTGDDFLTFSEHFTGIDLVNQL